MYFCLGAYQALTPNIEGQFACQVPNKHASFASGAFYGISFDENSVQGQHSEESMVYGFNFKALRFSSLYKNSEILRPQSISLLVLIRI